MKYPRGTWKILLALVLLLPLAEAHSASAQTAAAATAKSIRPSCNRAGFRVVVDVGHTLKQPGALSARGIPEYEFNLQLARKIEHRLVAAGFGKTTLLITTDPARSALFTRARRANSMSADLFLAIHHDSVPDRFMENWQYEGSTHQFSDRFKGHSIFVSKDNGDFQGSVLFASLLGNQLKARGLQYTPHYTEKFMGTRQRILVDAGAGVYRYDQLIVLRTTQMPAVLLEAGMIVNRDEELKLSSPERQDLTAAAVTDAVESFCALRSPRSPPIAAAQPARLSKHP